MNYSRDRVLSSEIKLNIPCLNVSQQRPTWWLRVVVYFWFCR